MKRHYFKITWFFIKIWLELQFCSEIGFAVEIAEDRNGATELVKGDKIDLDYRMKEIHSKNADDRDRNHEHVVRHFEQIKKIECNKIKYIIRI